MTTETEEFKISEERLAERVLPPGAVREPRRDPAAALVREAGAGRGQEARPARVATGLVHLHGRPSVTFIGPGRFETNGLEGDYEYRGTGADMGTLTLTVDIIPIPQVSDLTFDSPPTGTFAAGAGGVVLCEGGFELVDSTIPDTTPPSLVGAAVAVSGEEMALAFDEELAGVDSLLDLLTSALSVTVDGEPVPVDGYAYGGFGRIGRRLTTWLSSRRRRPTTPPWSPYPRCR